MAWKLTEGVRQDARGRLYRTMVNSRGKQDMVFVEHPSADMPQGYTVPVPVEQPKRRVTLKLNVQEQKRRLLVLEFREVGQRQMERHAGDQAEMMQYFNEQLRPLMRSPDQGATWIPVERIVSDFHNFWHKEAE